MGEARKQFTFYRSYYDAILELPKKDQSDIILAVCAYAIYEELPTGLSPAASTAFKLIKPTLDSGRRKAASGALGGASKSEANGKQSESKNEANGKRGESAREREEEREDEVEVEYECHSFTHSIAREELLSNAAARRKYLKGIGRGVVLLSDDQMASLLEVLSVDEFDKYVGIVADCEEKGQCFTKRTHYQAILDMAKKDRKIK